MLACILLQIVLPNTVCDSGAKTKLYQLLLDHFDETTLTTVQRKYFNESKGMHMVSRFHRFFCFLFGLFFNFFREGELEGEL